VLRGVLAHEIGHHVLGHRPTASGLLRKRQKHAANLWAALRLITPGAYAEAEQLREGYLAGVTLKLSVTDDLDDVAKRLDERPAAVERAWRSLEKVWAKCEQAPLSTGCEFKKRNPRGPYFRKGLRGLPP